MMNYFTQDNTEGFTDANLDMMNKALAILLDGSEDEDDIKNMASRVNNNFNVDAENTVLSLVGLNITFIKAQRTSVHNVKAVYSLNGTEFTVEWNNIHPNTGDVSDYDLQLNVDSDNQDLADRVSNAIREGETDSNPDLGLYLAVRDIFDRVDAENHSDGEDCGDLLNRAKAVSIVGEAAVAAVGKERCEFSHRVMNNGTIEFTAHIDAKNEDDDEVLLTAHYYQDEKAVNDCDELDELNWEVAGYSIT